MDSMNNIIKEIATVLENNFNNNEPNSNENIYIPGLSGEQTEQINQFLREVGKSALFPYPLKMR